MNNSKQEKQKTDIIEELKQTLALRYSPDQIESQIGVKEAAENLVGADSEAQSKAMTKMVERAFNKLAEQILSDKTSQNLAADEIIDKLKVEISGHKAQVESGKLRTPGIKK